MNRLVLAAAVFAIVLLLILWWAWPERTVPQEGGASPTNLDLRDTVLYFSDPSGLFLVSEERQLAGCNDERQCIAGTLEALAAGSKTLQPIISSRTRVLGVVIEEDLARINFSRDLVDLHPGGNMSELLTVYGLVNTLAVNFPYLRQLQILIEGKVEPTLKGHVDISRPVKAEFRYSHAPEKPQADSETEAKSPGSSPAARQ